MTKTRSQNGSLYTGEPILVAVDCIVFGFDNEKLKLLLFKRKVAPFKDENSLIGSFVKAEEGVIEAANRILLEFTGLSNVFLKELCCYSEPMRDSGGRVISIAHYALLRLDEQDKLRMNSFEAKWYDINDIPLLVLDHNDMVKDALDKLRDYAKYHPIGLELLPKKFTIPQLQLLYESIYQQKLDRRNFRKKMKAMQILNRLDEKDKSGSKKGAYLYSFDNLRYKELMSNGFSFTV